MQNTACLPRLVLAFLVAVATSITAMADETPSPVDQAIQAIEEAGGKVRAIAESVPWREVSFHLCPHTLTDETLAQLQQIPDLRWLYLQGTSITDDQLRYVAPLTSLVRLHLENTSIGDDGVQHLLPLQSLEYLNLYGSQISDDALPTLTQLASLKQLYLWQSKVSEQGLEKLRELMPNTAIVGAVELAPPPPAEEPAAPASEPRPAFVTGRFVRITLPGEDRILQLAEVEIEAADTGETLQTSGTASQSSTAYNAPAARAADGNRAASFAEGSVSHTQQESNPWWEIDLQQMRTIGRIRIWNRGDCCGERLQGAVVSVLDNDRGEVFVTTLSEAATGSTHELPES